MEYYTYFVQNFAAPLLWMAVGLCGGVGLVALAGPGFLASLNAKSKQWVDTNKYFSWTEKQVDVDKFILRYSRVFGLFAVLTAGAMVYSFFLS
jgi:hypothetical protein